MRRLSEFATLPVRGSAQAAGYDLSAAYDCVVPARGKNIIKTDLAIACPEGTYGRIGAQPGSTPLLLRECLRQSARSYTCNAATHARA